MTETVWGWRVRHTVHHVESAYFVGAPREGALPRSGPMVEAGSEADARERYLASDDWMLRRKIASLKGEKLGEADVVAVPLEGVYVAEVDVFGDAAYDETRSQTALVRHRDAVKNVVKGPFADADAAVNWRDANGENMLMFRVGVGEN